MALSLVQVAHGLLDRLEVLAEVRELRAPAAGLERRVRRGGGLRRGLLVGGHVHARHGRVEMGGTHHTWRTDATGLARFEAAPPRGAVKVVVIDLEANLSGYAETSIHPGAPALEVPLKPSSPRPGG